MTRAFRDIHRRVRLFDRHFLTLAFVLVFNFLLNPLQVPARTLHVVVPLRTHTQGSVIHNCNRYIITRKVLLRQHYPTHLARNVARHGRSERNRITSVSQQGDRLLTRLISMRRRQRRTRNLFIRVIGTFTRRVRRAIARHRHHRRSPNRHP